METKQAIRTWFSVAVEVTCVSVVSSFHPKSNFAYLYVAGRQRLQKDIYSLIHAGNWTAGLVSVFCLCGDFCSCSVLPFSCKLWGWPNKFESLWSLVLKQKWLLTKSNGLNFFHRLSKEKVARSHRLGLQTSLSFLRNMFVSIFWERWGSVELSWVTRPQWLLRLTWMCISEVVCCWSDLGSVPSLLALGALS